MIDSQFSAEKVIVVGASGFGREALDVLVALKSINKELQIVGVVDDYPSEINLVRLRDRGIPYLGTVKEILKNDSNEVKYLIGIGNPAVRRKLVGLFEEKRWRAFTAIHPNASIGTEIKVGSGTVICAGAVISTNVSIGNHVHINPNATIGHDTVLEAFVSVNPAAVVSGDVIIRREVLVGASATILQGIEVEEGALVGASSCVTKNVPSQSTVVGVPARSTR